MSRVCVGVVRGPEPVDSSPGAARARAGGGRGGYGGNLPPRSQRVCDRDGSDEEPGEVAAESGIHRRHAGRGQLAVAARARPTEINGIARVGCDYLTLLNTMMPVSDLGSFTKLKVASSRIVPSSWIERFSMIVTSGYENVVTSTGPSHLLV